MKENNERYLFDNFKFFKPDNPNSSMQYGFNCDDGWFDLIKNLCEKLEELNLENDFEVVQVKEKFGGLRFYSQNVGVSEEQLTSLVSLVRLAETKSFRTCEKCGNRGSIITVNGCIKTLCENCRS